MKKVIHFIRKSTIGQELDHQEGLLNETSKQFGWEVSHVIRETISGTKKNEDRKGIIELKKIIEDSIINNNKIDYVSTWEISRISRSPRDFHNLVSFLHEKGIGLYIKNLNLCTLTDDGKENHITSLILVLVSEISKMETINLKERVRVKLDELRRQGVTLGRPKNSVIDKDATLKKYSDVVRYLEKGLSLREVSRLTKVSINTTLKVSKILRQSITI
jgi:DNA invertase Pin-like site-specific DNA recombinase